jgi:hypothetical protein
VTGIEPATPASRKFSSKEFECISKLLHEQKKD